MPLDIFKKEKNKIETKTKIVIDFREKNSLVPSELINLGCEIEFKQLEIGDYLTGNGIVERKTLQDLQASVISKRIFTQLPALKSQKDPLLIIEGEEGWKIHENAFRGLILAVIKENVPIIFSKNPRDTAKYLLLISQQNKKSDFSLRPYKKLDSKEEISKYILEGIPGIGPLTAKKLLDRFGSIRKILLASKDELSDILGSKYILFKDALG